MARVPRIPPAQGELSPRELVEHIRSWAEEQGYGFEFRSGSVEYGVIVIRTGEGAGTTATVPNAHRRKRLRKDQVRYVIRDLNRGWKD